MLICCIYHNNSAYIDLTVVANEHDIPSVLGEELI